MMMMMMKMANAAEAFELVAVGVRPRVSSLNALQNPVAGTSVPTAPAPQTSATQSQSPCHQYHFGHDAAFVVPSFQQMGTLSIFYQTSNVVGSP
jgi:hypothetical protein